MLLAFTLLLTANMAAITPLSSIELYQGENRYTGDAVVLATYQINSQYKRATVCDQGECMILSDGEDFTVFLLPDELPESLTAYLASSNYLVEDEANGPLQGVLNSSTSNVSAHLPYELNPKTGRVVYNYKFDLITKQFTPIYSDPWNLPDNSKFWTYPYNVLLAVAGVLGTGVGVLLLRGLRKLSKR